MPLPSFYLNGKRVSASAYYLDGKFYTIKDGIVGIGDRPGEGTGAPPPSGAGLLVDRSMYPGGTVDQAGFDLPPAVDSFGNLLTPEQGGWPVMYWVPPGSTFQSPNGERVHRERFLGLTATEFYIIRCPEQFVNVPRGLNVNGGRGKIIVGLDVRHDKWMGRIGMVWRNSSGESDGALLPGPRPGQTNVSSADGSTPSGRAAPNDEQRAMMVNGNATSTGRRTFTAFEGTRFGGGWVFEGLNYNRRGDADDTLVIDHFHHDRVSVAYTDGPGKSGGDAIQMFDNGHPRRLYLDHVTVGASSIQAIFSKMGSGWPSYLVCSWKNIIVRGETTPDWGYSDGMLWQQIPVERTRIVENVRGWPSPQRRADSDGGRGRTVYGGALLAEAQIADGPDTTDVDRIGVNWNTSPVVVEPPIEEPGTPSTAAPFLNGSSVTGARDGSFAAWRTVPLGIAGTWNDTQDAQLSQFSTGRSGLYAGWTRPLDVAVGGIYPAQGDTWFAAAQDADGSYRARWERMFALIREQRPPRGYGQTFLRFAHEPNIANGYPWWVSPGQEEQFIGAWRLVREVQQEVFPEAKLVWSPNRETSGDAATALALWPGAEHVDVIGVDYYAQYPGVASQAEWDAQYMAKDGKGAPKGVGAWLEFAEQKGRPIAFPEWGVNSDFGDSSVYVTNMLDLMEERGGTGTGQVLYSIYFNSARGAEDPYDGRFALHPYTESPNSSAAYRAWHMERSGLAGGEGDGTYGATYETLVYGGASAGSGN